MKTFIEDWLFYEDKTKTKSVKENNAVDKRGESVYFILIVVIEVSGTLISFNILLKVYKSPLFSFDSSKGIPTVVSFNITL